jgi:hypothetical protein
MHAAKLDVNIVLLHDIAGAYEDLQSFHRPYLKAVSSIAIRSRLCLRRRRENHSTFHWFSLAQHSSLNRYRLRDVRDGDEIERALRR